MSDTSFHSYVRVFEHYLERIAHLMAQATPEALEGRLTPESFTALENFAIAQGYVLRSLFPLLGREVPELAEASSVADVNARGTFVRAQIAGLTSSDFAGAETRAVTHVAGEATLTQPACDFITLYGMPNFFFHLNMGYAILRAQGMAIGKGDFDGFHSYPKGFSFVTNAAETV